MVPPGSWEPTPFGVSSCEIGHRVLGSHGTSEGTESLWVSTAASVQRGAVTELDGRVRAPTCTPPHAGVPRHSTGGWMRPLPLSRPCWRRLGGGFFASWFLQGFVAAVSMVAGSCFSLRIHSLVTALFGFSLPGVPPQFMHLSKKNREEGKKIITIKKNPCDSQRWGFSRSSLASSRRAGSFNQRK